MASPAWKVAGQYYETCSCDFVCPCILTQLQARPSKGSCTFAMSFKVDTGAFGDVSLDGLGFVVVGCTPEEMGKEQLDGWRDRGRSRQRGPARRAGSDCERRRGRSDGGL